MITSFIKFISVFVAYYLATIAGLQLLMPSGQASIIWPGAGIAMGATYILGYRYALAVLCAALLSSLSFYETITAKEFTTAFCIGSGAALQAVVGTFLIRKWVGTSSTLETVRDIGKVMLFVGPVACCVNTVIATVTLVYAGALQPEAYISHIYSWWLGDVFGVLIFTPLIMLNFSAKDAIKPTSVKRKVAVTIPVTAVFIIFLMLFLNAKNKLEENGYKEFNNIISSMVDEFRKDLAVDLSHLVAINSFFNASEYVSAKEFQIFTEPLLNNSTSIFGVSWLPKVKHKDRESFEKTIRDQGYPEFFITKRTAEGTLVKSPEENIYFPLAYTEPYAENKKAHGFNVLGRDKLSKAQRKRILDNARDTGNQRATGRFSIVQKADQYGFIIYEPVYETMDAQATKEKRRRDHIGFINGIFVFPKLMHTMHEKAHLKGLDFILNDISRPKDIELLYDSRTKDFKEDPNFDYSFNKVVTTSKVFEVAGRNWEITVVKNSALLSSFAVADLWALVNGGIFINALLAAFLMVITARTEVVEKLVDQKTQDLQQANVELEEFAYRTSHDLRSPLLSSIGLLTVIEDMIEKGEKEKVQKSVNLVKDSLQTLEKLVQDILALTHLKGLEETPVEIKFENIIDESLKKFSNMKNFDRLRITQDLQFNGEPVALQSRVKLIVENLITNAIKYQDTGKEDSFIKIKTYINLGRAVFEIEDNGLRIPLEKQDHLFEMFSRFHPKVSYGSGLGLYMMKKSADILESEIKYEDTGTGSRFKLILKHN